MSAQPSVAFTPREAKAARCSYQHIAAIINRILNRIIQNLPEDKAARFKPSVFATIHSLHGFLNGREVSKKKPVIKAHKFVLPHFDYKGNLENENGSRFMDRRLDALAEAEAACGLRFIEIERANNTTLLYTSYEGHPLLDAAEWVYLMARSKPDYWKNPAAAITDDLLDAAIAKLPEYKPAPKAQPKPDAARLIELERELNKFILDSRAAGDDLSRDDAIAALSEKDPDYSYLSERWQSGEVTADAVLKGRWTKWENKALEILEAEFDAGADPELVAQREAAKILKFGQDLKRKLARERLRAAQTSLDLEEEDDTAAEHSGKEQCAHLNGGGDEPTLDINVGGTDESVLQTQVLTGTESEPVPLQYALQFLANGLAVLPLWGVSDGICDCPEGSECRSAGKHPHSHLARKWESGKRLKGVYSATTDEATVRRWFKKDPRINIGLAMGGALNLICVDIDPRNEGDATYCDLVEAHSADAFPPTYTQRTGGDGWHRVYRLPEGIAPKTGELKAELGPGVDIKGAGGLIVAAGSMHSSGKMYEVESNELIAEAPEWIVKEVVKSLAGEKPEVVIDFQAHRDRKRSGISGSIIPEGERNDKLFRVGCALWGKGEASDLTDLHHQLLDVNAQRCSPPLDDAEVAKIVGSITKYPRGVPIPEGSAA